MHNDIEKVLFTKEDIENRVRELGAKITEDYIDKNLLCIVILKGAMFFASDLMKSIDLPLDIDFMIVSSYGSETESSGVISIIKDSELDVKDRDVLIIEDIIDTGNTLNKLTQVMKDRKASTVEIATFLDKKERRIVNLDIKYSGFVVPDYFVVGYGMDFNEKYRNLPYIGYLKKELYS